jgi:hypothetical protein
LKIISLPRRMPAADRETRGARLGAPDAVSRSSALAISIHDLSQDTPPPIKPRAHKVALMNAQASKAFLGSEQEGGQLTTSSRDKQPTQNPSDRAWQTQNGAGLARLSTSQPKGEPAGQERDARPARASFRSIPASRLQAIARAEQERSTGGARSAPVPSRVVKAGRGQDRAPGQNKQHKEENDTELERQRAKMSKALVTLMSKLDDPEKFTKLQNMLQRWRMQASSNCWLQF